MMNKYIYLSITLITIFAWSACSDSDAIYAPASVNVSNTHILLDENNTYELSYNASHDWSISMPNSSETVWYEISPLSGKAGDGKITIKALANDSYDDRTIVFTLKSEEAEQSISVSQPMGCGVTDIRIPDEEFRAFCLEKFDSNKDKFLSAHEVSSITHFSINYYYYDKIKSFEGIQYFKSLKSLVYQYAYSLEELDLSKNRKLESLTLHYSKLEKLDLSNNTELNQLTLGSNRELKTLNISQNTKLKYLELSLSQTLSSVDISNNVNLEEFECSHNSSLENLTLGNHPKLLVITCNYNPLQTSLNVEGCPSLQRLYCYDNKLTSLELHKNLALEVINCTYNQIPVLDLTNNLSLRQVTFHQWGDDSELWLNKALENRSDISINAYYGVEIIYK